MRRSIVVIGLCVAALGLLLMAAFALRGRAAIHGGSSSYPGQQSHLIGFSLTRHVVDSEPLFTAVLTNHYPVPIRLIGHTMQSEDAGGRVMNAPRGWGLGHPWSGTTNFDMLLPNAVATICFGSFAISDDQAKRIRLVFQYSYDAGPVTKLASRIVTNLPVDKVSPELRYRLYQGGLLNGQHQRSYEGTWVSNEPVQRTGASRSGEFTNAASAAAGSGR